MKYESIVTGTFLKRPNRFIAHVTVGNQEVVCHVKNTGRCQELLIAGASVILQYHKNALETGRKTMYSLIAVYKATKDGPVLINMDSQIPNSIVFEWLCHTPLLGQNVTQIQREVSFGSSRFDLAFAIHNTPAFMEVKGVTLEQNSIAMFPDAPTTRGVKHILELIEAKKAGYETFLFFVIQMGKVDQFTPNRRTHKEFADALILAKETGVHLLAYNCFVAPDEIQIKDPVSIFL